MGGIASKSGSSKVALAEKTKRACDLRNEGWTLAEIAAELGYKTEGSVSRLIAKQVARIPVESATALRDRLNARYDKVHRSLAGVIGQTKLASVKVRALEAQSKNTQRQARLNHLEQEAPIIIAPTIHVRYDLSALSPDELEAYHALRRKVVVVREEVVEASVVAEPKALPPKPEEP